MAGLVRNRFAWLFTSGLAAVATLLTACGGGAATPTPPPPTATPRPAATAAPSPTAAPSTPTTQPPTATAPRPTPTPIPAAGGVPTPVTLPQGKYGGTMNTSIVSGYLPAFDTFSSGSGGSKSAIPVNYMLLNSLLWVDPYGKQPGVKVGDVATGWAFSDGGKTLTFTLNKGIKFHDGNTLTSKDVAYNVLRAWKPRSPRMLEFQGRLDALAAVETPDDYTVVLRLARPSNFLIEALSLSQFLIYPAHMPLPESDDAWRANRIGSGPFKLKRITPEVRVENVRNEAYWKPGLPYLDGVTLHVINDPALLVSSYRTAKLDANTIDNTALQDVIDNKTLEKEVGWQNFRFVGGAHGLYFNQRPPWTDPRVREAVDLAIDRYQVLEVSYLNRGYLSMSPLMPPAMGGQWGLSDDDLKDRPGFRKDKKADLAQAAQLLSQAGVDPSKVTVKFIASDSGPNPALGQVVDGNLRTLGFKVNLTLLSPGPLGETTQRLDFDLYNASLNIQSDDPSDFLVGFVRTGGGFNIAKWSNPALDPLLDEQDRTLDPVKRKQQLRDIQLQVLKDRTMLIAGWNARSIGANKFVKNYPPNPTFLFDSRYRWEQLWLDR